MFMQVIAEVDAKLYEQVQLLAVAEGLSVPSFFTTALREAVLRRSANKMTDFNGSFGKGGLREELSEKSMDELINATYDD